MEVGVSKRNFDTYTEHLKNNIHVPLEMYIVLGKLLPTWQ